MSVFRIWQNIRKNDNSAALCVFIAEVVVMFIILEDAREVFSGAAAGSCLVIMPENIPDILSGPGEYTRNPFPEDLILSRP